MSAGPEDSSHSTPTDRWAREICEDVRPQDAEGLDLEDAARARLFDLAVSATIPQDHDGRRIEDAAFAGIFGRPAPGSLGPRARLGKYLLGEPLGSGGMGEVFLATDTQLNRKVAIKVLRPRGQGDPVERNRLLREAQALAAVNHENVVGVHECGLHGDQVFLVMEYVEGMTLRAWQDAERRSWREVLRCYLAAGRGLAAIHAAGLVHRDFKPQNVLVAPDGRVKVTDFGLAVTPGERVHAPVDGAILTRGEELSRLATQLTASAAVLGTFLYISPEQLELRPIDARSDQFNFCVALYEALYGSHPYAAPAEPGDSQAKTTRRSHGAVGTGPSGLPTMMSLVTGLVEGPLRRPARIVIPGRVYRAIARGLSREPGDRHPSMEALLVELARDPVRKYGPWVAVAAASACLGAATLLPGVVSACKDLEVDFRDAWNSDRAGAVERAFMATGSAFADEAAARAKKTLDAYRDDWLAARRDNCEATRDRAAQDREIHRRRDACLDHARDTLATVVDQLTQADAALVERVGDALALIPALEECSAEFQRQQTCLDGADDPELRGRLDRALALEIAGKLGEAEDAAVRVFASADRHPRLAAEAQLIRGRSLAELGRAREASAAFAAAHDLSEGAGCGTLAFEAATRTTKLIALNLDLPADAGIAWSQFARTKLRTLPASPRLEADLHSDLGLLLLHREDLDGAREINLAAARDEHTAALELRERLGDDDRHRGLAASYLNLGALAILEDHPEDALGLLAHSLEHFGAAYPKDHPTLWKPHYIRGDALLKLERYSEARDEFEQALALAEAGLGSGRGVVGTIQYALAVAYAEEGLTDEHLERAFNLATTALAAYVAEIPDQDPRRADPLVLLGQLHTNRDEPARALPYREELVRRVRSAGSEERASAHLNLAVTLYELGRHTEAAAHLQLAAAFLRELDRAPVELTDLLTQLRAELVRSGALPKQP